MCSQYVQQVQEHQWFPEDQVDLEDPSGQHNEECDQNNRAVL